MVLKFEADLPEVYMIEATGKYGVALNKWSQLRDHVGPDKFYHKLIWRHVEFDRSIEMAKNLKQFLDEALDLKYGIGFGQITRF